jgi:hypothetical protein
MKYIITETQLHYLRRLSIIDKLIKSSLEMFDRWHFSNIDVDYMIRFLMVDVAELYFFRFAEDIYIDSEEYDKLTDFLEKYLNSNWRDKLESIIKSHKGK